MFIRSLGAFVCLLVLMSCSLETLKSLEDASDGLANSSFFAGIAPEYYPQWAFHAPSKIFKHTYNSAKTPAENGSLLKTRIEQLQPGDYLEVGVGYYETTAAINLFQNGSETAPIWVVAELGKIVTLNGIGNQPIFQVGTAVDSASYIVVYGFEITGGHVAGAVRMGALDQVWLDSLHIHHTVGTAVSVNQGNATFLYFTRGNLHHTANSGEGLLLGGTSKIENSIIANNIIHDTMTATQGTGISMRTGGGNQFWQNEIYNVRYPGILAGDNTGYKRNYYSRNFLHDCNDNCVQNDGGGQEYVNNVIETGGNSSWDASHITAPEGDIVFCFNTIIDGKGYTVDALGDSSNNLILANNVIYTPATAGLAYAITISAAGGWQLGGNVVLGKVFEMTEYPNFIPIFTGYILGNGLSDFTNLTSWKLTTVNLPGLVPKSNSPIIGAANSSFCNVPTDFTGALRTGTLEAGAFDFPN